MRVAPNVSVATLSLLTCACAAPRPPAPRAPREWTGPDPKDLADQEEGRRAFAAYLATWGSWDDDLFYPVRWCPARKELPDNLREFWPYPPYAKTDPAPEWLAVTSTRGHWVLDETGGEPWCWVPGVALRDPDIRVRRRLLPTLKGDPGPSEEDRMRQERAARNAFWRGVIGVVAGVATVVLLPLRR
jgi:hypothetical protein